MTEPIKLKYQVDANRCQGQNRCYLIAPELFEIDDLGNSHALHDGKVPTGMEEKARRAMRNCPEHAIRVTEVKT